MINQLKELKSVIEPLSFQEGLSIVAQGFPGKVVFSSALGQEDQVITDAIFSNNVAIEIFSLDTGRLFPETYKLIEQTELKYGRKIKLYFPETTDIETYINSKGINAFYHSVKNREECCYIRKVTPLKRALQGAQVWITGLRGSQSNTRQHFEMIEWDKTNKVIKFNPLIYWNHDEVTNYLHHHDVPYNPLHDKGYLSIGCAPCTRTILPGEDFRSGRWWWEASKKECGLHEHQKNY